MAVIHIMVFVVQRFVNGVGNHDCCTAGCVDLLIVVLFHDFDIELTAQYSCRFLCKLYQQVDAQRHIESEKYRDLLCSRLNFSDLLLLIAGCRQNQSHIVHQCIFQKSIQRGRI